MNNTHKAIVDEKLYNRIQDIIKLQRIERAEKQIIGIPLYKDLLICALCGQPLSAGKRGNYKCYKCSGQKTTELLLSGKIMNELTIAGNRINEIPDTLVKLRHEESNLRVDVKKAIECNVKGQLTDKALDDLLNEGKRRRIELEGIINSLERELSHARRVVTGGIPDELTREAVMSLVDKITVHSNNKVEIKFRRRESI